MANPSLSSDSGHLPLEWVEVIPTRLGGSSFSFEVVDVPLYGCCRQNPDWSRELILFPEVITYLWLKLEGTMSIGGSTVGVVVAMDFIMWIIIYMKYR